MDGINPTRVAFPSLSPPRASLTIPPSFDLQYVAGEMHNVTRDLPRVIHISMAVVTVLFTLANVSYFVVLDSATVARSNTVALVRSSVFLLSSPPCRN